MMYIPDIHSFLISAIRLGLSHLREHKFNHNFQDTVNPLCFCSLELESDFVNVS